MPAHCAVFCSLHHIVDDRQWIKDCFSLVDKEKKGRARVIYAQHTLAQATRDKLLCHTRKSL